MEIDKESGYLIPRKIEGTKPFDPQAKKTFLSVFEQEASVAKTCDVLGISSRTFYDHLSVDSKFRADYSLTLRRMSDNLESTMYKKAQGNNGYMYMVTWLRRHFPNEWTPRTNVSIGITDNSAIDSLYADIDPSKIIDTQQLD